MAKKQFSRLGLGAFVMFVSAFVLQLASALGIGLLYPEGGEPEWLLWLYTFVPMYLIAMPLGLLVMRKAPAAPVEEGSLGSWELIAAVFISFFLLYAGNILGGLVIDLLGAVVGRTPENPLTPYTENRYAWLRILVMVILAPMIEEYVFRKQLIDRMNAYGGRTAVLTSALMFGLFHGNLSQFFYAFAIGLVFGYLYLRTGRLRYTAILHMLINFMGGYVAPTLMDKVDLAALEEMDARDTAALTQYYQQLAPVLLYSSLIFLLVLVGLVLFIRRFRRTSFEPAPLEIERGERFKSVFLNAGMGLFVLTCLAAIVSTFIL